MLLSTDGVVVATPEKLDLLLRAHASWFESLRLVVVDEAHLLHESERGVRLELLLANLRRERSQARLLLLTPFLQNAKQIATWLGGARGLSIEVQWRPSRLLLGLAEFSGRGTKKQFEMELQEPYGGQSLKSITVPAPSAAVGTGAKRVIYLAERFQKLGCILALFSASPIEAEKTAAAVARKREPLPDEKRTPGLRVAIALARSEYGPDSALSNCLERGVAFHHSSLSPVLRFLVEDQVRVGTIDFIAATTTLAQGMNFPVAVVLVHSVHKPYGAGSLSPAEFWNIAGRAGRVGLVDKGLVIFTDPQHRDHFERYSTHLNESVRSALLDVLKALEPNKTMKEHYRQHEALRPFIQYLAHAAARESPAKALADLEELLQASLANVQVANDREAQAMRRVARGYLEGIGGRQVGYLRAADTTGLSSFSFDELFAKIGNDPLLMGGPGQVLAQGKEGISHLVEVLKWLPELDLAIGFGSGPMNVDAVAQVVSGWVGGVSVPKLAEGFPQEKAEDKIRQAARYLYGTVSQTMAWGAHAYIRGWVLRKSSDAPDLSPKEAMLGAYIQYGVHTPEAAVASLLGVPRQFAEPLGSHYRERFGELSPETAAGFKSFVEEADQNTWRDVLESSDLAGAVDPGDVRLVWRQMWGLL
jgi:hypothetical protein